MKKRKDGARLTTPRTIGRENMNRLFKESK